MEAKYANAYAEVYAILECLEEEEYLKIPKDFLDVIEKNRNFEYEYEINKEQDLSKQPMLIETRAILLKIFRDYLATPKQSEKIKKWQEENRRELEKRKQKRYGIDVFANKKNRNLNSNVIKVENSICKNMSLIEVKKATFIKSIFEKIKKFLKIK